MAYDLKLVQLNTIVGGLGVSGTTWGFPLSTDFHTVLLSFWMCGPTAISIFSGSSTVSPQFLSASFLSFSSASGTVALTNYSTGPPDNFYEGTFAPVIPLGMLVHCMLSVDTHAQVVQLYINDQSVPISGTWIGPPPFNFNIGPINIWNWNVNNVILAGPRPALADVWISHTPSFVNLSSAANRRKFINADLTAVDLGDNGAAPFGYQPALYMSVRPGGVATDILTNRGVGGGAWGYDEDPPSFQTPGACTLPPPPPAPPPRLAIDNVVCTAQATQLEVNLISLRWSDDRGHSWGSPVTQDIGEAGEYRTSLQWQRLSYSRDRVFELSWSVPMRTALQGAWVDVTPAQS